MPRSIVAALSAAAIIALASIGGFFYYQASLENEYSKNYVRALYAIKTGRDISREAREKLVAGVKESGQITGLRISAEYEGKLLKVKSSADKLMKRVNQPPRKYVKANEKLVRLYNIYSEMNSFTISPPRSPESLDKISKKLDDDFAAGVQDMKANLPQKLTQQIRTAQTRFKNLKDI